MRFSNYAHVHEGATPSNICFTEEKYSRWTGDIEHIKVGLCFDIAPWPIVNDQHYDGPAWVLSIRNSEACPASEPGLIGNKPLQLRLALSSVSER